MILERVNISESPSQTGNGSELCVCGFRGGKRVCINSEFHSLPPSLPPRLVSFLLLTGLKVAHHVCYGMETQEAVLDGFHMLFTYPLPLSISWRQSGSQSCLGSSHFLSDHTVHLPRWSRLHSVWVLLLYSGTSPWLLSKKILHYSKETSKAPNVSTIERFHCN